jgi:hypothetical protein
MPSQGFRGRIRTRIAAAFVSVTAAGAVVVLPAGSAQAAQCWYGACFSYVTGRQFTNTTGASVVMEQAAPSGVPADGHSLQELSLQTSGGTTVSDTIEIGWTVDPEVNGDYQPHLFVFHWINGKPTCYNGCGFVQVSSTVRAGMALKPGTTGAFALRYYAGNWWASYNGVYFGYFPGSEWSGAFTSAQVVSAFGEVAADSAPSCTQMGDGIFGSQRGASSISDYQLYGSSDRPALTVTATDPGSYNFGAVTGTSFTLGGPGSC